MTKDRDEDEADSTLPRRQLGRALEAARQGAGFSLERAAELMEMGKTSLGRIENGQNQKVPKRIVEGYGRLYGLDEDEIEELKDLAGQTASKSWYLGTRHLVKPGFTTYLGLESAADKLSIYQPFLMPGLLQTVGYARAVERPYLPSETPEDIERRVELRMKRAAIITRSRMPVKADFVIHESALHTIAGSRAIMAAQLRHLADRSTLPNVTIRILPFTAGFPSDRILVLPYTIVDFPPDSRAFRSEPPVVYTECTISATFFEEEDDVQIYRDIHETNRRATLEEQASRDLLRQVAGRYEQ
ncbi:helix-turn-helix domain-containing protein [Nocardia terpenica]|uniref:helix-turn-helix domain-containing protein n=1 Tax=Nocardia terpenica TaxID=455432 RepID=UPI002FE2DEE9